jgi:hypothetical protein
VTSCGIDSEIRMMPGSGRMAEPCTGIGFLAGGIGTDGLEQVFVCLCGTGV